MKDIFNQESRKKNAIRLSSMGIVEQVVSGLMAFIYRTVFIYVLSTEYLGISGLFTNIIQIFSLTDLGIGSVITYRLYQPIKDNNIEKVSSLLKFYKFFYKVLAIIIFAIGTSGIPLLPYIIRDAQDLPADININVIYLLYVIQSAASYMLVSNQILLDADQKGYVRQIIQLFGNVLRYVIQIIVLITTKNFTFVLMLNIFLGIFINAYINLYIKRKYKIVFVKSSRLKVEEIKNIFKDTLAMMCHKVGTIVVTSTDNIIMSMFIGTKSVGIYSNYYMIIQIIQNVMNTLLGSFTASIGNYNVSASKEDNYELYKKLKFANYWICSFCTVSLYLLLNPFIKNIWGEELLFSKEIVFILCVNFFVFTSRIVNGSFGNAVGLFIYDKLRPVFETIINLFVSVFLIKKIGISGIFLGTIISAMLTAWWREPYLLYKKIFDKSLKEYYGSYVIWSLLTVITSIFGQYMMGFLPNTRIYLLVRFFCCGVGINIIYVILFHKNENFQSYLKFIKGFIKKRKGLNILGN